MNKIIEELSKDTFRVFVPLEKSIKMDDNGDYIVEGIISSDDVDEQSDRISPEGMDTKYFMEKGWIKWEHGNQPNQFIGEPMEVRIGSFQHPKLNKSVNGVFVKGRLFANREMALQAVVAIEDIEKSHTKRTVGWSIEGGVVDRCRKTGRIIKSVLRNVVLTMNPVNTMTYAELAKSFTQGDEPEMSQSKEKEEMNQEMEAVNIKLEGLEKSFTHVIKQQKESTELMKSLVSKMEELNEENAQLRKSLTEPQGRKSALHKQGIQTIKRKDGKEMTRKEVLEILEKSFEAGELAASEVIHYETGASVEKLNLPNSVKEKLGG